VLSPPRGWRPRPFVKKETLYRERFHQGDTKILQGNLKGALKRGTNDKAFLRAKPQLPPYPFLKRLKSPLKTEKAFPPAKLPSKGKTQTEPN